jgi:hypothetical protein
MLLVRVSLHPQGRPAAAVLGRIPVGASKAESVRAGALRFILEKCLAIPTVLVTISYAVIRPAYDEFYAFPCRSTPTVETLGTAVRYAWLTQREATVVLRQLMSNLRRMQGEKPNLRRTRRTTIDRSLFAPSWEMITPRVAAPVHEEELRRGEFKGSDRLSSRGAVTETAAVTEPGIFSRLVA